MSDPIIKIKVDGRWHVALKRPSGMDKCACCSLKEDCGHERVVCCSAQDDRSPESVIESVCNTYGFGFRECVDLRRSKEDE